MKDYDCSDQYKHVLFNLCRSIEFSVKLDTDKSGCSIVIIDVYFKMLYSTSFSDFVFANNTDLNECTLI